MTRSSVRARINLGSNSISFLFTYLLVFLLPRIGHCDLHDGNLAIAIEQVASQLSSWVVANSEAEVEERRRPFVTLAYAQTLDGMIAAKTTADPLEDPIKARQNRSANMKISCAESMLLTHRLRSMHDAIMVGGSTFYLDNPRLTARLGDHNARCSGEPRSSSQPVPVVLDTHLRNLKQLVTLDPLWQPHQHSTAGSNEILTHADRPIFANIDNMRAESPVICCSHDAARQLILLIQHQQKSPTEITHHIQINISNNLNGDNHFDYSHVQDKNKYSPIQITFEPAQTDTSPSSQKRTVITLLPCHTHAAKSLDLSHVLHQLHTHFKIRTVMVEGGSSLLSSFFTNPSRHDRPIDPMLGASKCLADCICITISPTLLGGRRGLNALDGLDTTVRNHSLGNGQVEEANPIFPKLMHLKHASFTTLGQDCIFIGKLE